MEAEAPPAAVNLDCRDELRKSATFAERDDVTDVVFLIEDKKLYFNRTLLAMCSPMFKTMFFSSFKEKREKEIPLPGKKYEDMVTFLKQIHPVHSVKPLTGVSEKLLALADEYQVDHILLKCEQYIGTQIDTKGWLPTDEVLFYMHMCDRYKLTKHRDVLLYMAADREMSDLENCDRLKEFTDSTKAELFRIRCVKLERGRDHAYAGHVQILKNIMLKKSRMATVPAFCFATLPDRCAGGCYVCPHGKPPFNPSRFEFYTNCHSCSLLSCQINSFCRECVEEKGKRIAGY